MRLIYKIATQSQWDQAVKDGHFAGAPLDLADGFIHFSTAEQTCETAAKHFSGQSGLILVAVPAESLGEALKWEISRGGALFPHLYRGFSIAEIAWAKPLPVGVDGAHDFAGLLP